MAYLSHIQQVPPPAGFSITQKSEFTDLATTFAVVLVPKTVTISYGIPGPTLQFVGTLTLKVTAPGVEDGA